MGYQTRPRVSITKQRKAYARTKGVCVICGKPLPENERQWSVDHFIPRAVYKWVRDSQTKALIESGENIFIVHAHCNFDKDSALPTNRAIKDMHADREVKDDMRKLYKAAEGSIASYRAMKQSTLDAQGKKCAACGKRLSFNDATMRRIIDRKGRSRDNAMCLCERCNVRACSAAAKKQMVQAYAAGSGGPRPAHGAKKKTQRNGRGA